MGDFAFEQSGEGSDKIIKLGVSNVTTSIALADLPRRAGLPAEGVSAERFLALTVRDSGQGMTSETLAKIFDPFYTTKFAGRGLGLAAVHGIVHRQGGAIDVESEPGAGTSFSIYIPATDKVADAGAEAEPVE